MSASVLNNLVKSAFVMKCITAGKRNKWKVKLSLLFFNKKQGEKMGIGTGIGARLCLRKPWRASCLYQYLTFCHSGFVRAQSCLFMDYTSSLLFKFM